MTRTTQFSAVPQKAVVSFSERVALALARQRPAHLEEVAPSLPPINRHVRQTALAIEISVHVTHDLASMMMNATTLSIATVKRFVQAQAPVCLDHFHATTACFAMAGRLATKPHRHADQFSMFLIARSPIALLPCSALSLSTARAIAIFLTTIHQMS